MAELRLDGRVAIITGAGNGLGRRHALLLADRGAQVVVNDVGASVQGEGDDRSAAQAVVDEIVEAGGEAIANTDSVATPEGGEAIVQTALDAFGRIDIVVNNAGNAWGRAFHNLTPEMVESVLSVHLKGAFYVTRPAWVEMRKQRYGRVINTTSSTGILGTFGHLNYLSAKTGLWGFTRGLAAEGAEHGIKVNAIAPWAVSRMTKTADRDRKAATGSAGKIAEAGRRLNLDPGLVSPLVAFLAHESVPVTGQIYTVGGGRIARYVVATTEGIIDPDLTVERIRDRFEEIQKDGVLAFYENPEEELMAVADRVATLPST